MKLEKIEERQALWAEYWADIMAQQHYGDPQVSFWDKVFKPTLINTINTFDQWLFKRQRYDLVDFRDFEPWQEIGKVLMTSTISDEYTGTVEDAFKLLNERGIMYHTPGRRDYFYPAWPDQIDRYGIHLQR